MAIETILVAVGPMDTVRTEDLAAVVTETAGPLGASVVIGHAFTENEYEDVRDDLDLEERIDDVDPDEVAARRAPIPDLVEHLEDAGVDCSVKGVVDDHGQGVVSLADEVDADRVVVGGRRRTAAGKAVFGSTSQEVMQSVSCPVTYVGDRGVLE